MVTSNHGIGHYSPPEAVKYTHDRPRETSKRCQTHACELAEATLPTRRSEPDSQETSHTTTADQASTRRETLRSVLIAHQTATATAQTAKRTPESGARRMWEPAEQKRRHQQPTRRSHEQTQQAGKSQPSHPHGRTAKSAHGKERVPSG